MLSEIARRLGRPLQWRQEPFEVLLDLCAAGEVDLVCATLGITPKAESGADFAGFIRTDFERSERLLRIANFQPE